MIRALLLAAAVPAGLWAQAAPLPPTNLRPGAAAEKKPAAAAPAKEPSYPPLRSIELPKATGGQLPNGLRVRLVENHDLPMIQGLVMFKAGSALDPVDQTGLARLTVELLRAGGVKGKTAEQVEKELDRLGARVQVAFSETKCGLTFSAPRESAIDVLALLAAMATQPSLRVEKLEVAKALLRASMRRGDDESSTGAHRRLSLAIYGTASPYGREPTDTSVKAIRQSDVSGFYHRYFFPANTTVSIDGDFDSAAMRASVEQFFGGWTSTESGKVEFPQAAPAAPATYLAAAKDLRRVSFSLGQIGTELRDADAAAWDVFATILGGMRRSRLVQQVHSNLPGDTVELVAESAAKYDFAGTFSITGYCGEPGFGAVLGGILRELDRLRTAPVTDEELRIGKETAMARLAAGTDTRNKRLAEAVGAELSGYPPDFPARYQAALAAVTRADVERIAKTIDPAKLTLVAIGDTDDVKRQIAPLLRGGEVVASKPAEIQAIPPAPSPDAAERGRQLVARAQQASGGADKIAAIRDATRVEVLNLSVLAGGGGSQVITQQWIAPNELREETNISRAAAYTNGTGGWIGDASGSSPLTGALYEHMMGELFKFYPRLLMGSRIPGRTLQASDGDTLEILEGSRTARVVFDESGLPAELIYEVPSTTGTPIAVEEIFEDFRAVSGVKMPFRVRILHNGQAAAVVTVQSLKVNSGLRAEDLTKRR